MPTMIDIDWQSFGERVAVARKRRKHSQAALACDTGISRNYISLIERGHADVSYAIILTLCDALGIEPPQAKQH